MSLGGSVRTSGTVIAWTLLAALACGCSGPAPAPPAQPARPAPAKPAQAPATAVGKPVQAPSVTIGGQDAAETVARWQPPLPALERTQLAQARRDAARALAEDRLFEDAQSAIPLYLAIRALAPQDPVARDGLRTARRRLLQRGDDLLRASEQQEQALERADRIAMVALSLDADDPAVRRLQQRVETAQRMLAYDRAGEDDLRAGRLGEDGNGALANFREALQLDADDARARQGVAAVESALIRRAEAAATLSDFAAAGSWLARAARIRDAAATVRDARARVEGVRSARIAALRDAGLRDLATPAGLKAAREKLGEVLRIADPGDPVAAMLRERIDLATHYGSFRPGQVFTDAMSNGERGPQMIVVPHGGFRMGASDSEPGAMPAEQPLHYVRFDRGFAMAITEVTVAEFRRFVELSGARPRATRRGHSIVYDERSGNFVRRSGTDWQSGYNGARAAPNSPVMHVSVRDAEAYAAWLSQQTGRHYRLPSEAEFEYALRAGGRGRYPWGNAGTPPRGAGNFTGGGDVSPSGRHWNNAFVGYADGFWGPAPVASFKANPWGLHDMGGNLSEWVADCWHSSYRRAPADGAAWYNPGCRSRVVRGGNWANAPEQTRAAWRLMQDSDTTSARVGFRLVRGI
ncbi:SUMF1/EgtB/PvdO family nonheme iron enzyme [Xanthomonas translucens pv. undulosa]|nr:formylglycine-generating enzyme family protein [Xanthomonas translucens]MBC3974043.1 SUMF1/EgtB/PvdO family nonheme iron enzyme [Xanthomonas translucens pv. undulosa]MCT8269733.1 formylglycine-generating enzyme family protein [Xanthomonas translucens pv. undulosa]MCT8281384.1 formylglycine-generating enzyme family protein [Xanthomonas translucens pv. undulosa]MCT8316290.1 formylglycine-generating enzyme family protein [Xanthomonas translucens pv. undulosa]QEN93170.1 SUMF1/EgtB/PvdO family n